VANHAIGGRSSRSFIEEGRLDTILGVIQPGDYLFVQFGHNDASSGNPERYTSPDDYKRYLRDSYMAGATARGATPVLLTPVSRRDYDSNGQFRVSFPDYVNKVHELVNETGVAMIDLSARSRAYLNSIGPEAAKDVFMHLSPGEYPAYPDGITDDTHFSEYGADQMARIVSEGTAALSLPIAGHVR
jgi:lysophospholipase L1-like esterase